MATERLVNNAAPALLSALHIFVFGSTLLVYNVHSLAKLSKVGEGLALQMRRYKWRHIAFGMAGLLMALTGLYVLSIWMLGACLLLAALSFAYSLPLLPFKNKKSIREYGWLKIAALAIVWTIVTSVLPIFYWGHLVREYPFEVMLRFSFIFTLCIIFDLRDVHKDAAANIRTLPNKIGLRNSYRLIGASIILFVVMAILQYMRFPVWERLAGAIATAVITYFVAAYLRKQSSEIAYLVLGDGLMLVYAFFILLLP